MKKLSSLLKQLEVQIPHAEKRNPAVCQANVGWHIEHSLLVLNAIVDGVEKSDASKYKWKFNFIRTSILSLEKFRQAK